MHYRFLPYISIHLPNLRLINTPFTSVCALVHKTYCFQRIWLKVCISAGSRTLLKCNSREGYRIVKKYICDTMETHVESKKVGFISISSVFDRQANGCFWSSVYLAAYTLTEIEWEVILFSEKFVARKPKIWYIRVLVNINRHALDRETNIMVSKPPFRIDTLHVKMSRWTRTL